MPVVDAGNQAKPVFPCVGTSSSAQRKPVSECQSRARTEDPIAGQRKIRTMKSFNCSALSLIVFDVGCNSSRLIDRSLKIEKTARGDRHTEGNSQKKETGPEGPVSSVDGLRLRRVNACDRT